MGWPSKYEKKVEREASSRCVNPGFGGGARARSRLILPSQSSGRDVGRDAPVDGGLDSRRHRDGIATPFLLDSTLTYA
ncbi:hypothetical protein SUGI_0596070 [Cryptomeria japonica]|nr:hypothetical protein SUGI_0596070 [Cryptomeria japonica]